MSPPSQKRSKRLSSNRFRITKAETSLRLTSERTVKQLARELLKPRYQVYGFKTADLLINLSGHFQNPAQIRYELLKLRARRVIKKSKNKSFYTVSQKGWSWLWLEIVAGSYFKNPMISKNFKKEATRLVEQPSKIEDAYDLINRGLSQFTRNWPWLGNLKKRKLFSRY